MRVLGIDYGSVRVGLSLGDTETRLASPWTVVPHEGALALCARIHDIILREQVGAIVVGVPRPLRDPTYENEQVREVRKFIKNLAGLGIPIHEEDEVMSSGLAARQAQEMGEKGKRDDLAAAVILQSWPDRLRG